MLKKSRGISNVYQYIKSTTEVARQKGYKSYIGVRSCVYKWTANPKTTHVLDGRFKVKWTDRCCLPILPFTMA